MTQYWFKDRDGSFFRNANCVRREMDELRAKRFAWRRWERLDAMHEEWRRIFWQGPDRKPHLDRGDVELQPTPFRVAYPQYPILWTLDGSDRAEADHA